jgi:hypothetical protein
MENKIEQYNPPELSKYDQRDAFEYYANEAKYEAPEQVDEETQYDINRFKRKKIGANALRFVATFGKAA